MDLTEIMDFLTEMNDGSESGAAEDEHSTRLSSTGELSPLQRSRANTWHGNRSIIKTEPLSSSEKENRTTPIDSSPNESYTHGSSKHMGIDHSGTVISRKSISRRNAWGNFSYADMITKAINSSPEKRMTLSEIYNWMVQNIPFFKDKGDTNSSAGWKNSIRHNLSLHSCFMRMQNEGTGKSSWWMINPDYKSTKLPRRRAATMDNSKALSLHQRKVRAGKKADLVADSSISSGAIPKSCSSDLNFSENNIKAEISSSEDSFLSQDFRPRSSSNSVRPIRLSPTFETDDLTDNAAAPWPTAEVYEMDLSPSGLKSSEEYLTKMFQSLNNQVKSPTAGVNMRPIPVIRSSGTGPTQLPNSLPVSSNMPQAWRYDASDQDQFLKQNSYKNIRASEHLLMSGGGLIAGSQKNAMGNFTAQQWMVRSTSTTPLLRDYLSRDDFETKMLTSSNQGVQAETVYSQKLYSGGAHKVSASSQGPWQQHPQSNHGLLLQLLTENTQQQVPERRESSPLHHTQSPFSHSPTNKSMLQHLLTSCQKNYRQQQYQHHQQQPQTLISSHQRVLPSIDHQRMTSPPVQTTQHFYKNPANSQQLLVQQSQAVSRQSTPVARQQVLQQRPQQFAQQVQLQQQLPVFFNNAKKDEFEDSLLECNFPTDLDFSLLELDSSADIECNIDQVIDHEKKFGEPWDFNFDDDFLLESKNLHESVK